MAVQSQSAPPANVLRLDDVMPEKFYDHRVVMRLMRYVLAYKAWAALAFVGIVGNTVTNVLQPLIIAWGINSFIAPAGGIESAWGSIHLVGLAFMANAGGNLVFHFIQDFAMARLTASVLDDIRKGMFSHIQGQSVAFHDRNEVGRVMSRVQNDVGQVQEFMDMAIITVVDIAILGFIAATMLWMDLSLGLVTLITPPVLLALTIVWKKFAKVTFLNVAITLSSLNDSLQENISGVRVSQAMNRQERNKQDFEKLNREHLDASLKAARLSSLVSPSVEIATAFSMALVLVVGGQRVLDGSLEVGFLVAFLLYVQRLFDPIRTLSWQFTEYQWAMASGARIFELLDMQPDMTDKADAKELGEIRGDIRFENVSFSYTPESEVLKGINLHIEAGQTVALVGPTGAGKTTLALLSARFYDVGAGRVLVDGEDVRDVRRASLARQMSIVLQDPFLFSDTVKENIRYCRRGVTEEEIVEAAKAVGAHDFISRMEKGYDTVLQERGGNLSIGQRQLISFARAVASKPRILILDEATANVDSASERVIQEALRAVLKGRTSIVIAHRLSTITGADKIVVVDGGRIVEEGRHRELLARGGLYARLYSMNFAEGETKV
ncbi:MAG: ABC transporter ATP-binding protein [SAR202 cluster bacterium]|nr:ABC transporter ATP-binding protein [SAR202 cluster bacterium]